MSDSRNKRLVACFPAILLVSAAAVISIYQLQPGERSIDPAIPEFSCERAASHVQAIAKAPHPVGSPAHAEVREYIKNEILSIGCEPQTQETPTVKNILVRLEGTDNDHRAVLLSAHYDTVSASPGAGDNSSAVGVMLETLRCLKTGPAFRNDVICLFSDAEEIGLKGAEAFSYLHPWARDAELVLNFDARGNRGPAIMFETSNDNGWLIENFARAAPYPVASSLSQDIYKLLPNKTDFTTFKQAGIGGLNIAFLEGLDAYHTAQDTIENLSRYSLHHQATYALPLVRHFANVELKNTKARDAVYFSVFGSPLIFYSQRWVVPLAFLISLMFLWAVLHGKRKGRLTYSGIMAGVLAVILNAVVTSVAVWAVWLLVAALKKGFGSQGVGGRVTALLLVLTAIGTASTFYALFLRKKERDAQDLMTGGLVCWLAMTVVTGLFLPGGSYLFAWPSLAGIAALAALSAFGIKEEHRAIILSAASMCALPAIILIAPIVYLSVIAFTLDSLLAVFVIAVPTVAIVLLLTPQIESLVSPLRRSSL